MYQLLTGLHTKFGFWPASARELTLTMSAVLLALLPHVPHLPIWIPVVVVIALIWRIVAELRAIALPGKWLRNSIAAIALLTIMMRFRTLNGLEAGTALLSLMSGIKLLETRDHRDYSVLVFISFFLIFAELLYDQSLWMLPFAIGCSLYSIATLMRIHDGGAGITLSAALKRCVWMAAQAAPFAILLFLFFPRLQGQFWALPSRGAATSGLSDSMSPGDVSNLSLSDEVAFRVEFNGPFPAEPQRYWRTIVLHDFDGRTWKRNWHAPVATDINPFVATLDYRILLEPNNQRWLPLLDVPISSSLPRSKLVVDRQLIADEPITMLTAVNARSSIQTQFGDTLSTTEKFIDTRLPLNSNPKTRELARSMSAQSSDTAGYIKSVLRMFNQQHFFYTLEPSLLGADPVDDFLFNTRNGFCEHYASAFTVMMRAAGIPARVVTGYQGGEINHQGNYMIVRQSDAHAWSEAWLSDRGWVRIDPTAAIAPERINRGLSYALPESALVPGRALRQIEWLSTLRMSVDAVNTFWKKRVLQFDATAQRNLLKFMGIDSTNWRSMGLLLGAAFFLFFMGMLGFLAWRYKPASVDPVLFEFLKLQRKLEKRGIVRQLHEGPYDYLTRAAVATPSLTSQLNTFRDTYLTLRYGSNPNMQVLQQLKLLVSEL